MFEKMPNVYSLRCAKGEGISELNAFDVALLKSGIGNVNLVKVSSILPPRCEFRKNIILPPGALVPVAYTSVTSSERGNLISAAVAIAIPKQKYQNGLIMEYEAIGKSKEDAERTVREMAEWGMEYRGFEIERIESIAVSHIIEEHGCAFACVVLWKE